MLRELTSGDPSPAIMRDPRVRAVPWRDLVGLSRWETVRELTLPLPWLGAELFLHARHYHGAASAAAFMFFLACLRVAHDVFHRNLSLRRWADDLVLAVMSPVMVTSLHAIRVTHLRHHVHCMVVGQMLAPFFAVWTVHHDCDRSHYIARTLRNRFKSLLVLDMFFHIEHHLFPRVPTRRLPVLAERLDRAAPELSTRQVY